MKLEAIKIFDCLFADDGFTCLRRGQKVTVREDASGKYVRCGDGKHYLDGQLNERGHIVGFMPERVTP